MRKFLFFLPLLLAPVVVLGATYTWVATTSTSNWSVSSSWSGNVVPTASDVALFSASGTADSAKDININALGINIVSGYTGTISDAVVTVASSGPASGGTFATSTNNSATGEWVTPGNASASDNSYATANLSSAPTSTYYLVATNFSFAIPSTSTVIGIVAEVEKSRLGSVQINDDSVKILQSNVISGTEKATATNWPTSDAYTTYGTSTTDLWGLTWTPTLINSSGFGVAIAGKVASAGSTARIDHIRITVYYFLKNGISSRTMVLGGTGFSQADGTFIDGTASTTNNGGFTVTGGSFFDTGGNVTVAGGFTQSRGSYTASPGILSVNQAFNVTAGTFFNSTGTILLAATSSQTLTSTGVNFFNLVLNNALVGYWKMDDSSLNNSSSVLDYSGYGNNGTSTNMAGASGPTSTTNSNIKFNNPRSFNFDGTNDYISVTANASSSLDNLKSMTASAWVYSTAVDGMILGRYNFDGGGTSGDDFQMYVNTGPVMRVEFGEINHFISSTFPLNTWTHFATTLNSGTINLYKNGVLVDTAVTTSTAASTNEPWLIGTDADATAGGSLGNYHTGLIDDLRIYNIALNPVQINSLAIGNEPGVDTNGVSQNLGTALTVQGNLYLNAGWLDASSSNITVTGNWMNHGGLFNSRSQTVTLNGTVASGELLSGGQPFGTLTINGAGGTYITDDRLYVSSTLNLTAGTLGVATGTTAYVLHTGTITQTSGLFTASSGRVVIDTSASSTLTVSSTLNNLDIEATRDHGMVGYWKFDEGTGSSTRDWSGNGNTAYSVSSTPSPFSTSTVTSTIAFDNPFSMSFDGTDDYLNLGTPTTLNITGPISISSWVNISDMPTTTSSPADDRFFEVVTKGYDGTNEQYTLELFNPAGTIQMRWLTYNGSNHGAVINKPSSWVINTWHHYAGTFDGSTWTIYLDGISQGSATDSQVPVSTNKKVYIGALDLNGTVDRFQRGLIDDLRIYNRALGADEVAELAKGRYSRYGSAGATSTPTITLGTPLTVTSSLTIYNGNLDVSASNYGISLAGNWSNYASGTTFVGRSGTVTLTGGNQAMNGTSTFSALTKNVTVSSSLTFSSTGTQVFTGTLTLNGASGQLLSLNSSAPGTQSKIDSQGARSVSFLNVVDNFNINNTSITCPSNCNNGGNDTGWIFTVASTVVNNAAKVAKYFGQLIIRSGQWVIR